MAQKPEKNWAKYEKNLRYGPETREKLGQMRKNLRYGPEMREKLGQM